MFRLHALVDCFQEVCGCWGLSKPTVHFATNTKKDAWKSEWVHKNTLTVNAATDRVRFTYLFAYMCVPTYIALHQRRGVLLRPAVCVGPVYSQCHHRNGGNHLSGSEWLQTRPLLCLSARWAQQWHPQKKPNNTRLTGQQRLLHSLLSSGQISLAHMSLHGPSCKLYFFLLFFL